MSVFVRTIIGEALSTLNVYQPGASIKAADSTFCLAKLNQIFDNWNADRQAVWCDILSSFTLTPNLSSHTIGPSGATWTLAVRPVTLDGCSLNLNTQTPNVYDPIAIIGRQEYEALSVPGIATSIPTAVYYEADWPNGKLFFYPIPNYAYGVRIATRTLLAQVALSDSVTFPPGYQNALTLTLVEDIADTFGRQVSEQVMQKARQARARIFANNHESMNLNLQDGQQRDDRSFFNYHSRSFD